MTGLLRQELQHLIVVVVGNEDVGAVTYNSRWSIPGGDGVDDDVLSGIDDRDGVVELVVDINFVPVICHASRPVSDTDGFDDGVGVRINNGHGVTAPVGDVDIGAIECRSSWSVADSDWASNNLVGVGVDDGDCVIEGDRICSQYELSRSTSCSSWSA